MDHSYRRYQHLTDKVAAGGVLTESEQQELDRVLGASAEARREHELMTQLSDLDVGVPDLSDDDLLRGAFQQLGEAEKVVALRPDSADTPKDEPRPAGAASRWSSRTRALLATGAVAAAAAAAFALWPQNASKDEPRPAELRGAPGEAPPLDKAADVSLELALTSGQVVVNGRSETAGARVLSGDNLIEVGDGRACLSVNPTSDICLGSNSALRLRAQAGSPGIELEHGDAFVITREKDARASGPLKVYVGKVWSSSVRAAYVLARAPGGKISVRVHEGQVQIAGASAPKSLGPAQSLVIDGTKWADGEAVARLQAAADQQLNQGRQFWHSTASDVPPLGRLLIRTQPPGASVTIDGVPVGTTPMSLLSVVEERKVEVALDGHKSRKLNVEVVAGEESRVDISLEKDGDQEESSDTQSAQAPDLSHLLERARSAVRSGDWGGAAAAYRQIRTSYPARPESRTILVALGQLELDRLGQPAQALSSFEGYLRAGGSLDREARLGQIRALRSLGRSGSEAAALREYLSRYPKSSEESRFRARLRALQAE